AGGDEQHKASETHRARVPLLVPDAISRVYVGGELKSLIAPSVPARKTERARVMVASPRDADVYAITPGRPPGGPPARPRLARRDADVYAVTPGRRRGGRRARPGLARRAQGRCAAASRARRSRGRVLRDRARDRREPRSGCARGSRRVTADGAARERDRDRPV